MTYEAFKTAYLATLQRFIFDPSGGMTRVSMRLADELAALEDAHPAWVARIEDELIQTKE